MILKYLDINISLIQYTAVKNLDDGDIGIIFEDVALSPEEGPGVSLRSLEDIMQYFSSNDLLSEFHKVLNDLKKLNVSISPYKAGKDYWIECRFNDADIGYFQPRRKYFNCQI